MPRLMHKVCVLQGDGNPIWKKFKIYLPLKVVAPVIPRFWYTKAVLGSTICLLSLEADVPGLGGPGGYWELIAHVRVAGRRGPSRRHDDENKGCARRLQEFLGWEGQGVCGEVLERGINKDVRALWQVCMRIKVSQGGRRTPYVAIPACGGGWECARVHDTTRK